jgi:hypothetical protein
MSPYNLTCLLRTAGGLFRRIGCIRESLYYFTIVCEPNSQARRA